MAFIRAFQVILIILMVASMPFLHSFQRITTKTTMAEETSTITEEHVESNSGFFNRLKGGGLVLIVEKREVPTGPDPLHHNSNPTKP